MFGLQFGASTFSESMDLYVKYQEEWHEWDTLATSEWGSLWRSLRPWNWVVSFAGSSINSWRNRRLGGEYHTEWDVVRSLIPDPEQC